jgi:tripeptide aminopeptidase
MKILASALLLITLFPQSPDIVVDRVMGNPKVKAAMEFMDKDHDRFVQEIITITEIEAPPFKESRRAQAYLEMLRRHGLTSVEMDAEGNVMGLRKGTSDGPLLAVAAHLDTVFPEGTDVKVKRQGTRLSAPGIGDDSQGLALILAILRALDAAQIQTRNDILFIGNVGEEGLGDLRGVKYLFQKGAYKDRIRMFVSIDGVGPGDSITNGALGSKRYRVTFKGPGGHSYGAFGIVNPAFALGNAMDKFSRMQVPADPKTTYSVGVVGGGTSVNSIPFDSWMEVDMRSESPEELAKAAEAFIGMMHAAAEEENKARSTAQGKITVDIRQIGDRPSGATSVGSTIVQSASMVIRALGMQPDYKIDSTDANLPISLKIPAITIDSSGQGGRAHALDEWIDVEKTTSLKGMHAALGLVLTLAGVQ